MKTRFSKNTHECDFFLSFDSKKNLKNYYSQEVAGLIGFDSKKTKKLLFTRGSGRHPHCKITVIKKY